MPATRASKATEQYLTDMSKKELQQIIKKYMSTAKVTLSKKSKAKLIQDIISHCVIEKGYLVLKPLQFRAPKHKPKAKEQKTAVTISNEEI